MTGRQPALLHRGRREAREADDIADSVDMRLIGLEMLVDLETPSIVRVYAGGLELEIGGRAGTADRIQRLFADDLLAAGQRNTHAVALVVAERLDRADFLAEAQGQAEKLKGEGDEKALNIVSEAAGKDYSFYAFWRSLQAYRETLKSENTTYVLSPDGEFFKYLGAGSK